MIDKVTKRVIERLPGSHAFAISFQIIPFSQLVPSDFILHQDHVHLVLAIRGGRIYTVPEHTLCALTATVIDCDA